jgi:hypothetical protein
MRIWNFKVWNSVPTTDVGHNYWIGGEDSGSVNTGCTASIMSGNLEAFYIYGTRLIACDSGNNRVLIWNTIPTAANVNANIVLGQADFTSSSENRGGSVAANTLSSPVDAWTDGTKLVVSDEGNNRVLIWSAFPTTSGQAADVVIGQSDMEADSSGLSAYELSKPYFIASDGTRLIINDQDNHRNLVFNTIPTANGASADSVIGQPSFDSNGSFSIDYYGPAAFSDSPAGLFISGNTVWCIDYCTRLLKFNIR